MILLSFRTTASDVTTDVNGYNAHKIQEFTSSQNEFDHLDESLGTIKIELAELFR